MEPTPTLLKGLRCPACRSARVSVLETCKHLAAGVTIRYRECTACGTRFKTREVFIAITRTTATSPLGSTS